MLQRAAIWPREYNTFLSGSTQLRMKLFLLTVLKLLTIANSFLLNYAEHEMFIVNKYENAMKISLLINMKIPTIVGIFIFISRKKTTQLSMKLVLLINLKLLTIANSFLQNLAENENVHTNKYENAN